MAVNYTHKDSLDSRRKCQRHKTRRIAAIFRLIVGIVLRQIVTLH